MVYLRSFVAGTVAIAMAAAVSPIIMGIYFYAIYRPGTHDAIGWDPTSCAKEPLIWVIALLVFLAGFAWEFRRAHFK